MTASDHNNEQVEIDYSRPGMPVTAAELHPVTSKRNGKYVCISTADSGAEISGEGDTPELAVQDWDRKLQAYNNQAQSNQELADQVAAVSGKHVQVDPNDKTRSTDGTQDVKEGLPVRSEINPDNGVEEKPRKYTTDESNKDGSEFR